MALTQLARRRTLTLDCAVDFDASVSLTLPSNL